MTLEDWIAAYQGATVNFSLNSGYVVVFERRLPARRDLVHLTDYRVTGIDADYIWLKKREVVYEDL